MIAALASRTGEIDLVHVGYREASGAPVTNGRPGHNAIDCDPRAAERVLVQRILAGDAAAEREFYEAHVDRVYQLARRMARDDALAQELTQDTFVRAFGRLAQFRGEASVGVWVRQVALSVICNGLQSVRHRRAAEVSLDTIPGGVDAQATFALTSADSSRGDIALHDRLMLALDALPAGQRMVVLLHDVEGYHHHEIAEVLHIKTTTSKVRLFRARAALRPMLAAVAAEWDA